MDIGKMNISVNKHAGFITISFEVGRLTRWLTKHHVWNGWSLHLFVRKDCAQWGFSKDWYDGPLYSFGLGRLLLFCTC